MTPPSDPKEILPTVQELNSYMAYEPTGQNRYMCWVTNERNNGELLPAYLIRKPACPSITRISNDGEKPIWQWNPLEIKTYDAITPDGAHILHYRSEDKAKFDMIITTLGPVGDIIEKWELKNAKILKTTVGSFEDGSEDPEALTLLLGYDYATLKY